jgi:ABC-type antimicrobial peptide transport system permease subunit
MVGPGLAFAAWGVLVGIGGAMVLARMMAAVLFVVRPTDAPTYVAVSLLLIVVTLLASYVPARRATSRDPLIALRTD